MSEPSTPSPTPAPPRSLARRVLDSWRGWNRHPWFRWSVDLALIALLLGSVASWQTRGVASGAPVPEVPLTTLDGAQMSLSSLRGKPVVVEVWAPWCGVCKAQASSMRWLKSVVGDRAHVVSIALSYGNVASVERFMEDHEVTFPVYLGHDDVGRALGVSAFPTILFLDAEGRIERASVGFTTVPGMLWRMR